MDTTPLQTTVVSKLADLEAHRDAWRALAQGAPMRSPEWLLVWWQHYAAPDDELCVLLFREREGALAGLAPLYIETVGTRRTLRLLGSGEASTNHSSWLAAAGRENQVSLAVARCLLDLSARWHCLQFDAVDADDAAINATVKLMAQEGCLVHRKPLQNCWRIALPSNWEEYLAMLSKVQRKRCRRLKHLFFESGRVRVHRVTSPAELPRGFDILLQLHGARWGEAGRPLGCFSDQRFREFHQEVALELLQQNQLLLIWLEYDGKPVAVEYQFMDQKTVYSYQAGMDPSVSEFPPGNLSILVSILFAIARGCDHFDLSRGDQPYKANWRATPTATNLVCIWPDRLAGRMEHALFGLRGQAESVKKRAVKWLKARLNQRSIHLWRRLLQAVTGRRRGPRRAGDAR